MSENKPYIIGIAIGLSILFILLLAFAAAMIKLMKNNKKMYIKKALFDSDISNNILEIAKKIENAEVLAKNTYQFSKFNKSEISNILITNKSVYLINNIYITKGKLLGSANDNYLDIKIVKENGDKFKRFKNPFIKGNKLIKKLNKSINLDTSIKLIYIFNDEIELQIDDVFDNIYLIKESKIKEIITDLENQYENNYLEGKVGNISSMFKQYVK